MLPGKVAVHKCRSVIDIADYIADNVCCKLEMF